MNKIKDTIIMVLTHVVFIPVPYIYSRASQEAVQLNSFQMYGVVVIYKFCVFIAFILVILIDIAKIAFMIDKRRNEDEKQSI